MLLFFFFFFIYIFLFFFFFFSSRRRHTRYIGDWSSDVCSSDLKGWQNVSRENIAMPTLTNKIIIAAILGFQDQKRKIEAEIAELRGMLSDKTIGGAAAAEPLGGKIGRASCREREWRAERGGEED